MADCYDIVYLILKSITDFESLFYASQVSILWRQTAKQIMPQFIENYDREVYFKITKIRFLLDLDKKDRVIYSPNVLIHGPLDCDNIVLGIKPVYEDENYVVYESDELLPLWKFRVLSWQIVFWITGPNDECDEIIVARSSQITPDDLNSVYFKTGNKYKQENEDFVIGSTGGGYVFHCCCGVKLLPDNRPS